MEPMCNLHAAYLPTYLPTYLPIYRSINNMCPDEEKGCSARDLMNVESCRAENLLSNDIKYVMIGQILTKCLPEHSTVGTHRKQENA